jgi:predicted nucleic acid-binding protein
LSALFDTSVVVDYLYGRNPAEAAFERFAHRAITITSWVEIMVAAPDRLSKQTRDFLRTFEKLAVDAAIADHALALMQKYSRLQSRHAIPWATARVNRLVYVTADFPVADSGDDSLWIPYRTTRRGARSSPAR